MVGLNKTREQLSGSEEKIKSLQLEVQRTQMDLLAKTSECSSVRGLVVESLPLESVTPCAILTRNHTPIPPNRRVHGPGQAAVRGASVRGVPGQVQG